MSALPADVISSISKTIESANAELEDRYPVRPGARQPVHTVYGGAHLFKAGLAAKLGKVALRNLDGYGGDAPAELAELLGLEARANDARALFERVRTKLDSEPVEDFRIDFEDGYGNRSDEEEDGHAVQAAEQTAEGMKADSLPPFIGIRIKPFSGELYKRSLRTLELYLRTLAEATGGKMPDGFAVTLPKIKVPEQVAALCGALDAIEESAGISRSVPIELMVETTQAIIGHDGRVMLPALAEAAQGRCRSAHFGTYDYTAECGITAAYQTHTHAACDYARHAMQVAFAGTGIMISDGATTTMPVPVHRAAKDGPALTTEQQADNRASVHAAWKLHAANIRHSLAHGIYQGWDLHPAQLVVRYAAVYDFFHAGLPAATERLKNFVGQLGQATLSGDVFDDAATGQGLLNFFLLGIACGAFDDDAALACGLTEDELRSKSFVKIAANRRK